MPKNWKTKLIIKNDRNTSTSPTRAATIVPLAASTFALSPPETTHLIPPKIRKPRAKRTATTKRIVMTAVIKGPIPAPAASQRVAKRVPGGQGFIVIAPVAAKADGAKER